MHAVVLHIWPVLAVWLVAVNGLDFILMGVDKRRAQKGAWRIPECTFFVVALLGGTLGAILGMRHFRHKTKHWYFWYGLPLLLVLQVALCGLLWWRFP